ncbi:protein CutA homolog isoform X2 [Tachysurus fulvidraco]|uniref:protein CutA homolog isoform X2 n=1 Tax=Tachysurus fulvidraco TaxID=1234273 RepID=UPI001FED46AA|nr:protein CutA homolog isoform X2 [Tachysurus fulvidraco]
MDRFCPDQMSKNITRARSVTIFWTLILTMMLYPVMSMLVVQMYTALTGRYLAGHHSVLLINCPTEQIAKDIGRHLMQKKMAACVTILPPTFTMFYWNGEIQDASEILLLVRTRTSMIQRLTESVNLCVHLEPYIHTILQKSLVFPFKMEVTRTSGG